MCAADSHHAADDPFAELLADEAAHGWLDAPAPSIAEPAAAGARRDDADVESDLEAFAVEGTGHEDLEAQALPPLARGALRRSVQPAPLVRASRAPRTPQAPGRRARPALKRAAPHVKAIPPADTIEQLLAPDAAPERPRLVIEKPAATPRPVAEPEPAGIDVSRAGGGADRSRSLKGPVRWLAIATGAMAVVVLVAAALAAASPTPTAPLPALQTAGHSFTEPLRRAIAAQAERTEQRELARERAARRARDRHARRARSRAPRAAATAVAAPAPAAPAPASRPSISIPPPGCELGPC